MSRAVYRIGAYHALFGLGSSTWASRSRSPDEAVFSAAGVFSGSIVACCGVSGMHSRNAFSESINIVSLGLEDFEAHLAGGGIDITGCPDGAMVAQLDANGNVHGAITETDDRRARYFRGGTKKYRYESPCEGFRLAVYQD